MLNIICQVPIALGTQTGGSTIRPGSFNGIYAFKVTLLPKYIKFELSALTTHQPTWGAISREGLAQYSMTCDTLGLYARSVADLELLSSVFQLADDEPIPTTPFQIKGSKIAFIKTHVWPKAGPGTKDAWEKAKSLLEKDGASVEEIELPSEFSKIMDWHHAVLSGEGRTSFLGRTAPISTPRLVNCADET
jgi:Asp-tRNA(Asn)/Glu-tRNA(Gln) amidotransferase A subunit family amidase